MTKYVCFLRAINVGGNNIIKMDKLKKVFEKVGCKDVQTYIQSGNVLFNAPGTARSLKNKIEKQIRKDLKLDIEVNVFTTKKLQDLIQKNPFAKKKSTKESKKYVALFMENLSRRPKLPVTTDDGVYEFFYPDTELALIHRKKIKGRYDLYKKTLDTLFPVNVTVRNWNVVEKIVQKAQS